LGPSQ